MLSRAQVAPQGERTRDRGGGEGGFAPDLEADLQALELILSAIDGAGLRPGTDVVLALDPAASGPFVEGAYVFRKSGAPRPTSAEMIDLCEDWARQFPIWSIEDGLAEDDWDGWRLLTRRLGARLQIEEGLGGDASYAGRRFASLGRFAGSKGTA